MVLPRPRTALVGLGLGGGALFATRLAALAQDATPEAPAIPWFTLPLNGVWHWTAGILSEPADNLHCIVYPHGLCLEFDPEGGVGVGFWLPSGEREAVVSMQYQQLGGEWDNLDGPVETLRVSNVPKPWDYRSDILRVISSVTVNADGDGMNATGYFSVFQGVAGENVYNQGHSRSATRIA